jgi:hypothetical protein
LTVRSLSDGTERSLTLAALLADRGVAPSANQ